MQNVTIKINFFLVSIYLSSKTGFDLKFFLSNQILFQLNEQNYKLTLHIIFFISIQILKIQLFKFKFLFKLHLIRVINVVGCVLKYFIIFPKKQRFENGQLLFKKSEKKYLLFYKILKSKFNIQANYSKIKLF